MTDRAHIAACILMSLFVFLIGCEEDKIPTDDEIREALEQCETRNEVEEYLETAGIDHSFHKADVLTKMTGVREVESLSGAYFGIIRDVRRRLFWMESVEIIVGLDRQGKVRFADVRRVTTGL